MSDKQLQRVTERLAYIGHATVRRALPDHRHNIQKIRIARIARTISIALEYGSLLENLGDLLAEAKYVTSIDRPWVLPANKHFQRGGLT